ncbi:protease IV [Sphingomonas changbaiensis NBRC 104936]|uniref:Protease IV n=1 Tax=Sphingomonas changbaiensis NBRC 104936 TaxID=1219043 RepID=A0A0E9MP18_9SPHN|nr:signal peptide peptidase SppA [Sphingomonas changbaiensis]GAO39502.1 protease IV [Sphingomonas changbaiensis NBRC 104936]
MRFLAGFWRLLVGIKDALVLIFMLLFFGALHAVLTYSPNRPVGSGALLLDLNGTIVEQPADRGPLDSLTAGGAAVAREHRLRDVVRALDAARTDDDIKAVVLDLDRFLGGGQVALETVGEALDRVKRAGKPVFAYATGYTDDSYLLAAHASEVWMSPMGGAAFAGPGGSRLYYKGLLDKLGVNAHVYRVGAFKSAVEPYIRTDQSPEARQANEALATALWQGWQRNVANARPKARLAEAVANPAGAGNLSQAAVGYGLVDKLGEREAFGARVAQVAGKDDKTGGFRTVRLDDWTAEHPLKYKGGNIGVVTVAGTIEDGNAGLGSAGGETIARTIRQALARGDVKALVVRIDSPGGSALASERIRSALLEAKAKGLPVVVSMGSVAASGGYWVASAGDHIFAEPTTITGSIGVFGVLPTFEASLAKIGITTDGVKTTPLSGQPDLFGGTTPAFDKLAQTGVDDIYGRFIALVAASRHLAPARVNEIGQGRVWDGGSARQLGLVDAFGGLDDAVAEAARRAKISSPSIVYLEKQPSWWEQLASDWSRPDNEGEDDGSDMLSRLAARQQAIAWTAIDDARRLASGASIQARCLECEIALAPRTPDRNLGRWLLSLLAR